MKIMPQFSLRVILFSMLLAVVSACHDKVADNPAEWAYLIAPQDKILVKLAISDKDQRRGFSGIRNDEWPADDGILFLFDYDDVREFWMPDTFFDLDLFYLDGKFKVIGLERSLPHFMGRDRDRVPRARPTVARHVLELKSSSKVSQRLKVGDQLRFESPNPPPQTK